MDAPIQYEKRRSGPKVRLTDAERRERKNKIKRDYYYRNRDAIALQRHNKREADKKLTQVIESKLDS